MNVIPMTLIHGSVSESNTWEGIGDESVQTVCTSPPYWGLRDYGVTGQLGLEKTPEEYVENMVKVFRFVRQKLRKDGTLWLNLGDTYSAHKDCKSIGQTLAKGTSRENAHVIAKGDSPSRNSRVMKSIGLKNKDLVGIPWMVAFALRSDGWWLRSDIIWSKPNPMPESVTDRPTKAHEYIFLLTKSAKYFYDAEAVREKYADATVSDGRDNENGKRRERQYPGGPSNGGTNLGGTRAGGANIKTVWHIATQSFNGAHFATFPERIPELCIKAGTSEKGCCEKCGSPVERVTEKSPMEFTPSDRDKKMGITNPHKRHTSGTMTKPPESKTIGWQPTCACNVGTNPCLVLDPFSGSGTTGEVALRLGRKFVGIELNEKYVKELIEPRLENVNPLFNH